MPPSSPASGSQRISSAHPSTTERRDAKSNWGAVVLVAAATFTVVTSEMMPVGLLGPIGLTLVESEGTIGLSLTITGLVAAATAPLAPVLFGRFDRRSTLILLMMLVAAANALTALATNFAVLAAARVLLGLSMGAVWALAAGLAPRLVRGSSVGLAITIIFSGIALASVLGVPGGTYIGAAACWQSSFWALTGVAGLIALAMIAMMPRIPSDGAFPLSSFAVVVQDSAVRAGLVITAVLVTAHFAAYTYIRPALESFARLDSSLLGVMLLIYGAAGIGGNFIAGLTSAKFPKAGVAFLALGIAASLAFIPSLATNSIAAALVMAAWGLLYGGVSVSTQSWVTHSAPAQREVVAALWVSVFNASIALGAFAGGRIYDGSGPGAVFYVTAGIAGLALLFTTISSPVGRYKPKL